MKRKGGLLQRMTAVLLSAVLVAGMVSNAVPMTVLAQEPGEAQESVSGNSAETAEGDIVPEEGTEENAPGQPDSGQETPDAGTEENAPENPDDGQKPAEPGTGENAPENPDGGQNPIEPRTEEDKGQGSVSENDPGTGEDNADGDKPDAGEGEDPSDEQEDTQDTVSDNDVDSVSENDVDTVSGNDINIRSKKANRKARMLPQTVSGEITSSTTWADGVTVSDVTITGGASAQDAVVITVSGSVTVTGTIEVASGHVRFTGGGSLNWENSRDCAVVVSEDGNVVFENVTLDGGKTTSFEREAFYCQGTLTLRDGTTVQNFYCMREGSVFGVFDRGSLTVTDGVTVTGNKSVDTIIYIITYQDAVDSGQSASVMISGGAIMGNTVGNGNRGTYGVIWNRGGRLKISGGTVTAEGNEYAVFTERGVTQDATGDTVISGGTLTGNTLGAVCNGNSSSPGIGRITIAGGIFKGKTAVVDGDGTLNIEGGSFTGSEYALATQADALNVTGGEFYGGKAAYSGNVTTTADQVIVGTDKESAADWDKSTALNTYKYVAIGEIPEQPGDNWKRNVNFKIKVYGYHEDYPMNLGNVGVIWEGNIKNPVLGEVLAQQQEKDGYYLWEYVFKGLDTGRTYSVKDTNSSGILYDIPAVGTAFEETAYAINYYDGDTLAQVMYMEYGKTAGQAWEPPAKEGYTFAGWMTEKNGSDAFDFENTQIKQVTNVYASWTPEKKEWTLDDDGKLTVFSDAGMEDWLENYKANTKDQITSVVLEEGVTGIPYICFQNCKNVTAVSIPGSVESIGNFAFNNCTALTSVTLQGNTPPKIGAFVFGEPVMDYIPATYCKFVTDNEKGIHVPAGTVETYKEKWSSWKDYITDEPAPVEKHEHNDVTFTAWTQEDSLPTTAGNYYLTKDVTLTETWNVPDGETKLCLNGKTITQTATGLCVISIGSGRTLRLYDCGDAGKITSGKARGGVIVNDGATFYMYGGNISGNIGSNPAVYVLGEFHMSGGKISGNKNGIYAYYAKIHMSGGEVTANPGSSYGAIYLVNTTMTAGGNIVIAGNTDGDGKAKNLVISSGTFTIDPANPLSGSANIGVTTSIAPTEGSPVNITGTNSADYSQYFHSDNPDYEIENGDDNVVQLVVKATEHVHIPATAWTSDAGGHWHACRDCEEKVDYAAHTEDSGTVTVQPTETTTGKKVYKCTECEYVMRTETLDKLPPSHTHTYGAAWNSDETNHWHECTGCGEKKDIAAHTEDSGTVTVQPTETTTGTKEYKCSVCEYVMRTETLDKLPPSHTHTYGAAWNADETNHWHECTGCGEKKDIAAHTEDDGIVTVQPTETTTGKKVYKCTECDYVMRTETLDKLPPSHTHTYGAAWNSDETNHWHECTGCGEKKDIAVHTEDSGTVTVQPTETTTGAKIYKCTECNYVMRTETLDKLPPSHTYGAAWNADETNHWHECTGCGEKKDIAAHTEDNGIVTVQPTEDMAGTKIYKCTVCEYVMRTETIPATGGGENPGGDQGEISTEVEKGDNAPATGIVTSAEELADKVLTPEEKQQVAEGTDIKIILEVKDVTGSIGSGDKQIVERALDGYTIGQYLDISLFKEIGQARSKVTRLNGSITITINVPDSLKNKDSKKTRTFAVLRVHDGLAQRLEDQDKNDDTVTIATNCFSTYTIVYKDTAKGGNGGGGSGNTGGNNGGSGGSGDNSDNNGGDNGGGIGDGSGDSGDSGSNSGTDGGENSSITGGANGSNAGRKGAAGSNGDAADKTGEKKDPTRDREPKTDDTTPVELYATLSMVAGLAYLLLYFADRRHGMTEETKKELVAKLVGWAKRGGRLRRLLALAAIFILLVYYHSIGKKVCVKWEEVYEE